jgi:hypothetical protein
MISGPDTYTRIGSHDGSAVIGYRANAAFSPGDLVELVASGSELKWRQNGSATEMCAKTVALDKPAETDNTGIDDAYAADENVEVAAVHVGAVWYAMATSGETVAIGTLLQSNGDGEVKAATATTQDAQLGWMQSLDALGTIAVDTRCRVTRIA